MEASVIIPTFNEERAIGGCLEAVGGHDGVERIVADGGSTDATVGLAAAAGARVVSGPRGRGPQLNAGAAVARHPLLLFVHADCRLPAGWREPVASALAEASTALAVFRLRTEPVGDRPVGRLERISIGLLDLRSRGSRLPYGDQGFAVRREIFEALGGFPDIPIMEDVAFARACRRHGAIRRLPLQMRTSARRVQRHPVRSRLLYLFFPLLYSLGVPPPVLDRWYGVVR